MTGPEVGARPARMPRSERRRQLLDAARQVFSESGYHAAAMDDIAERAGVSKPVLYQHYPGKMDFYLALVDAGAEELIARIDEALASTTVNKARVAATMQAYFAFIDDASGFHRLLFESDVQGEPEVKRRLTDLQIRCAEKVAAVIAEDTGLPADEAMVLGIGMVGTAQVTARYWVDHATEVPRDRAADLVSVLGWRGIRGFPKVDDT